MSDVDKSVEAIIERLRKMRESKRMSQLDLSLTSGVSQTMISQMESGKRIPTLSTFLKICDALDTPPETVIGLALDNKIERELDKAKALEIIEKWM